MMLGLARSIAVALCLIAGAASGAEVSEADRQAIRAVISGQIEAFREDDAATAFGFASPGIQSQFSDPGNFIAMVKKAYLPVYRPRQVEFAEIIHVHGALAQQVVVVGPESDVFSAYYLMERQPDGEWRINGCLLEPIADRAI
jgi:hypothetical protein